MKKKVVFLIGGLKFGGMERVVFIANQLLKDDFETTIVTLYKAEAEYNLDFDVYDLNLPPNSGKVNKAINMIKRIKSVKEMKRDLNPDAVFSFGMYPNYLNSLTKGKEKIIMGIRSYDWLTKPFTTKALDKWIVNRADSVNSVSKVIAEEAERTWKIPLDSNRVIYNPYDIDHIECLAQEEMENNIFRPECFNIVSAGRLADQKGYNHLIKAFSLVVQEIPKAHLFILGNGDKKETLKKLLNELGLKNNVTLLGGKSNPYKYMKKADLYVMSSLSEGFPNALVEAMAVQTPILSTDCKSGPREILSLENYNKVATDMEVCEFGVIVPPMSGSCNYDGKYIEECEEKLAEGIIFMIKNRELRKILGEKSKNRVQQFSYSLFKESLIKELNSVCPK
ncbi:glycosyltransferase [Bacillus sp. ISL-55]|uniref:glycosyltransferase n=1 Tax=Bacillus sp. ISL-55 TaxID=2819134 RepID=UPI001BE99A53|nr:glycosyltransferase [Bacillus sp. ISL-55]MBT2694467.1 glycosyltransferase [Bacillus sp. ISL-55]